MKPNNDTPASTAERDIAAAAGYSRYLERLLSANPAVINPAQLETPYAAAGMQVELDAAGITDDVSLGRALRRLRQRVMARLIVISAAAPHWMKWSLR
jgi:glutamine synthetase adenylyltransferase